MQIFNVRLKADVK